MSTVRVLGLAGCAGLLLVGTACDLDQSFLFPTPIEGVPAVMNLGTIVPVPLSDVAEIERSIIYGEIGPTGTTTPGGLSFEFEGVDGSVCIWLDPELVFWNESVAPSGGRSWYAAPDNVFDDGDLDVIGGQSVYYSGSPGVSVGGFVVRSKDELGNEVFIDQSKCIQPSFRADVARGFAGRGFPEFCEIEDTLIGVRYTVAATAYNLPLDDDRLGFGLLISEGPCQSTGTNAPPGLREFMGIGAAPEAAECLITGEGLRPGAESGPRAAAAGLPAPTWLGKGEAPTWEGSVQFERAFCEQDVARFCRAEQRRILEGRLECAWEVNPTEEGVERCYCGDPANSPRPGGL